MYKFLQYAAIVSLLCLFSSEVVVAQSAAQNLTQCRNASSVTHPMSDFVGQWYEASRSPASQSSCVGLDIFSTAAGIYFNLTTSQDSQALNLNHTTTYTLNPVGESNSNISINATSPAGGYTYQTSNNESVTIKILEANSSIYAVLCGYSTNANSSFGVVLTRQRLVTNTTLTSYVGQVNNKYAGFDDLTNVYQSPACYQNSAATHASALSLVFAVLYAAVKFMN